ncbi:hypothetical protein IQ62_04360 [Streptomyces scabiei]|uniref:DUF5819 family protein n=1 Tax=Streptomyces scabiei TaxID=1930 RepID=UPI0004E7A5FF|nr:DUF5819 family protein [Streptomyces scabiei]KFG01942.1 hypothetical protein IQ62_04360 [Streptomyces scabiei]
MRYLRIQRAALLAGAALLGAHFFIAAFSQAPLSPAKIQMYPVISGYLDPYFTQNWSLFAPDPASNDEGIIARVKCADGTVTDYYDVTGPLIKGTQEDRFFPSRLPRLVSTGIRQLNDSDDLLLRLRKKQESKNVEDTETSRARGKKSKRNIPLTPFEKRQHKNAERALSRFALTQMRDVCPAGAGPTAVQARMYVKQLPPWSQRNNSKAKGKLDLYDLPWRKAVELQ